MFSVHTFLKDNQLRILQILAAVPVLAYFFVLYVYAQNIPYWDDYVVTLQFFNNFFGSNAFSGKTSALLAQWSEHRIVIGRILSLIQFYPFGILNFKILHLLANTSVILIFILLLKDTDKSLRKWLILPIVLLLFQLQYYVATFWFVSSSSMFFVLLFALASFYFFKQEEYAFCALFGVLALFSNGNGFLVLLLEILFLFCSKKFKPALVFVSLFVILMAIYFHGYIPHENDRLSTLYFLKAPLPTGLYFLSFLGGCFNLFSLAPVFGLGFLVSLAWLSIKKHYLKNPSIYLMVLFIVGSAFLAAIGRSFWGVDQALESRYKIFSIIGWICLLIAAFEYLPISRRRQVSPFLLGFCLMFNVGSYYKSWPFMMNFQEAQKDDYKEVIAGTPRENLNEAHSILMMSREKGYYK